MNIALIVMIAVVSSFCLLGAAANRYGPERPYDNWLSLSLLLTAGKDAYLEYAQY